MKQMKKFAVVLSVIGGIALGEYVRPYASLSDSMKYHNVPVAKNFPSDPWNYFVQREIEEHKGKEYQTLYLVNKKTGLHKKIDEDGCTCGVGNSIDDALHDARTWLGEKVDAAKSWVKEAYEHK